MAYPAGAPPGPEGGDFDARGVSVIYISHRLGEVDEIRGYAWWRLAALAGSSRALRGCKALEGRMSPETLDRAEQAARSLRRARRQASSGRTSTA